MSIKRSLFFMTYPVMHPAWLYYGIACGTGATGLHVETELDGLDPDEDETVEDPMLKPP